MDEALPDILTWLVEDRLLPDVGHIPRQVTVRDVVLDPSVLVSSAAEALKLRTFLLHMVPGDITELEDDGTDESVAVSTDKLMRYMRLDPHLG